ncbi:hypothetical protein AAVH_35795 [Aphelenchoides avenae]|nr:hypothetical protein AAVH_35795 [Aphelenchus avenae]
MTEHVLKQLELHTPNPDDWKPITAYGCKGISEIILNGEPNGRRTILQRWDAGASSPHVSAHPYYEEIYVIEGSLTDRTLGKTFGAGSYAYRYPRMPHGPYDTENGCTMLVLCTPPGETL